MVIAKVAKEHDGHADLEEEPVGRQAVDRERVEKVDREERGVVIFANLVG